MKENDPIDSLLDDKIMQLEEISLNDQINFYEENYAIKQLIYSMYDNKLYTHTHLKYACIFYTQSDTRESNRFDSKFEMYFIFLLYLLDGFSIKLLAVNVIHAFVNFRIEKYEQNRWEKTVVFQNNKYIFQ